MGRSGWQGSATLSHVRVGVLRLGLTLVTSLVLALVVAAPAMAGNAFVDAQGQLNYEGAGGGAGAEMNTVTVRETESAFVVSDSTATVTAGAGCTLDAGDARCAKPIQKLRVHLGDGDDELVAVDTSVVSTLVGGLGNDTLNGGNGIDHVNGSPGADTINVRGDRKDKVTCDVEDTAIYSDPDDEVTGGCPIEKINVSGATTITGPVRTNDTTPAFTFTTDDQDQAGFECAILPIDDPQPPNDTCVSGEPDPRTLGEGPYRLMVRARDGAPGAGPWAVHAFDIDTTAPQVTAIGPLVSPVAQPTFDLSSNETVTFECALEPGDFAPCGSSFTTPVLANGSYALLVRGTDQAGNATTNRFPFTVQISAGGGATNPLQPRRIIIESLVLISGKPVRMSRKGHVSIRLQCAGTKTCQGKMSITTAEPVKRKSRKLVTLGSTKFKIAANKSKRVKVRFSKSKRRLAKRLKRFKAKVVIREIDQRGNARISSRVFILRAR